MGEVGGVLGPGVVVALGALKPLFSFCVSWGARWLLGGIPVWGVLEMHEERVP